MKVVINTCYGGFSLSHAGTLRYAELKGLKLHCYRAADGHYDDKHMVPVLSPTQAQHHTVYYYTEPLVDGVSKDDMYFSNRPDDRADPALVQTVEELGKAADGGCAELKVVTIPDGIKWAIEEYNGLEWVAEEHRTWY